MSKTTSLGPSVPGLIVGPNAWLQRKLQLRPQHRGVHLVTEEIVCAVRWYRKYGKTYIKYKCF